MALQVHRLVVEEGDDSVPDDVQVTARRSVQRRLDLQAPAGDRSQPDAGLEPTVREQVCDTGTLQACRRRSMALGGRSVLRQHGKPPTTRTRCSRLLWRQTYAFVNHAPGFVFTRQLAITGQEQRRTPGSIDRLRSR